MTAEQSDFRASIKVQYGFADWPKTRPQWKAGAKRGFVPRQGDLEGRLVLERRRALPDHRNAYIDYYRVVGDPQVLFSVTVIEHETPEQAHEGLVDFLTTVMAPALPTASEKGISAGDIGFAGTQDLQTGVAFVRGTVFVRVLSIGDRPESVKELAELLDHHVGEHLRSER